MATSRKFFLKKINKFDFSDFSEHRKISTDQNPNQVSYLVPNQRQQQQQQRQQQQQQQQHLYKL